MTPGFDAPQMKPDDWTRDELERQVHDGRFVVAARPPPSGSCD